MGNNTQKTLTGFIDIDELIDDQKDSTIDSLPSYTEEDLEDESEQSYEEGMEEALNSLDITNINSDSILEKQENTRGRLAVIYVISTFVIFALGMVIAVLDGLNRNVSIIENLSTIIPLLSGVFLGTLGFVLGYYFRKENED